MVSLLGPTLTMKISFGPYRPSKHQLLLSLLSSLLLFPAMPGSGSCWFLLFVALVPFLSALRLGSLKQAVGCALVFGVVHFLLLLYWLVNVLGHYGGLPIYLTLPALCLLALAMSSYVVVFSLYSHKVFTNGSSWAIVWGIPFCWIGLDWLRSFLFSGFPWMDLGYGLAGIPLLIQSADIWGHYGISFLLVQINVVVLLLWLKRSCLNTLLKPIVSVVSLFCLLGGYTLYSFTDLEQQIDQSESMEIGVVQGNISQDQKWSSAMQLKTVNIYLNGSRKLLENEELKLVVWPETALPFYPQGHPLMVPIFSYADNSGVSLLTGSPWYERSASDPKNIRFYNSALLIQPGNKIAGRVSKTHLVPFGEYVPLKKILFFLGPLVEAVGDFSPGEIRQALACHKAKIGVLICFESIFPSIARQKVEKGATLLVNMTNDAWYGDSSAPHHSFAMAIFRAVETRRSLVRSANTGFSGLVDPLGRVVSRSPLFEPWEASFRVSLLEGKSLFVRGGYLFAPFALLFSILVLFGVILRK